MTTLVRPELPTAALRSQATHATVDNSASFAIRPDSTYKSGKVVQTTGATSSFNSGPELSQVNVAPFCECNGFQHFVIYE
jgi:hypothetical protein